MVTRLFLLIVLVISSTGVIAQNDNLYLPASIPSEIAKGANAVVRLNQLHLEIESQSKMRYSLKRVVTVFNERGNEHVNAFTGYDKNRKVKKIQAFVFDENGNQIKKFNKSDFIDHSAVDGGTLYSDSRVLYLGYMPIVYPYTVEFICEIETPNTAAIPSWMPQEAYYVGIEKSSYTLIDNASLGIRTKEKNFQDFAIESTNSDKSFSYTAKNLTAMKPEELGPSLHSVSPRLLVASNKFHYDGVNGEASDWKEFGDWMHNSLLINRDKVSEKTKEKILNLTANVTSPLERARLVYEFVQNNTRYISVQVGIGGIQPISAYEVDELKYGDCKGLTNYTQSLLKIANVDSYYTVVQAGNEIEDFEKDFASLEQGNHIILGIPDNDKMVWVDCTSQYHPFGFIGNFTDARNVLMVKPNESLVVKTSNYVDSNNQQLTKVHAVLKSDASVEAHVDIQTTGIQYDTRFLIERESNDNIQKYYKNYWSHINNLTLENYNFKNDKDAVEFSEALQINAQSFASVSNDQLIFCPGSFNRNGYIPDRYRNRHFPLVIQRGYHDEDRIVYSIPEEYEIGTLPEPFSLKTKFGEYHVKITKENNQIIFNKTLLIKHGTYPKSDYDLYREFRKEISKHDATLIALNLKK